MAEDSRQIGNVAGHRSTRWPSLPKVIAPFVLAGIVIVVAAGIAVQSIQTRYEGRIHAGVSAMGVDLGGYTPDEAQVRLSAALDQTMRTPIHLRVDGHEWTVPAGDLGLHYDVQQTVDAAYLVGREGNQTQRLRQWLAAQGGGVHLAPPVQSVDVQAVTDYLNTLAPEIERAPMDAQLELKPGQQVVLVPAQVGRKLDVAASAERVTQAVQALDSQAVDLVVRDVPAQVNEAELESARAQAERILSAPITLQFESQQWELGREQIAAAMTFVRPAPDAPLQVQIDETRFQPWVEQIGKAIARAPRNPRFELGPPIQVIAPGEAGREIDVGAALAAIRQQLLSDERVVQVPVNTLQPSVNADSLVQFGAPTLIDRASTVYGGTHPDRMHNIELAMSRLNGTVVAPGETFSFNNAVGEVSFRTGYKRGYAITQSEGEVMTIPSEGGGICQVATTLFQSVFWAGYPIVERNWHLYWIPRYGQPPRGITGLDATIDQVYDKNYNLVYSVDLRFTNDTDSPIVIQTRTNGQDAIVSLYGKKPDWTVQVDTPVIDQRMKADHQVVRQYDPTLPRGASVMVEHAEDGFRAQITRRVVQNGTVLRATTFTSTYAPSRNVYLVGG